MNKKGFTLVELLAVIGIIGLIAGAGTTIFVNIQKNVRQKNYDNLVVYLQTAAETFANDNNQNVVSVEELIKSGYVKPDDEENIYSPIDSKILNCYIIELEKKNNKYEAISFTDNGENNGKCNSYEVSTDYIICNYDGVNCIDIDSNNWFNDNITLAVKNKAGEILTESSGYEIKWSSNMGDAKTGDTITTSVSNVASVVYTARVTKGDEKGLGRNTVSIDKESPVVAKVTIYKEKEWTVEKKNISIRVTDKNGSGVDKVYIADGKITSCADVEINMDVTNDIYKDKVGNGDYSVCVKDKVGNVSSPYYFTVSTVDSAPTIPIITSSDGVLSKGEHTSDYTLSFKSTTSGNPDIKYYYGTSSTKMNTLGSKVNVTKDTYGVVYYVKACSATSSSLCSSGYATYYTPQDTTKPTITFNSTAPSGYTNKRQTIKATIEDTGSGVVAYYISDFSSYPSSDEWIEVTKTKSYDLSYKVAIDYQGTNYFYVFAKDAAGNVARSTGYRVAYDTEGPVVSDINFNSYCDYDDGYIEWHWSYNFLWYDEYSDIDYWETAVSKSSSNAWSFTSDDDAIRMNCGDNYFWMKAYDTLGNYTKIRIGYELCDCDDDGGSSSGGGSYSPSESVCASGRKIKIPTLNEYWCFKEYSAYVTRNGKCPSGYRGPHDGVYCCVNGSDYNTAGEIATSYECTQGTGKPYCKSGTLSSDYNTCS